MTEKVKPPTAPASAPVDPGADEQALGDGVEAIRAGLRKAGGVLGTAATAIIGGLGYVRLHEVFPVPEGKPGTSWAAAAGAILAIVGAAALAGRFFAAQRRVLLTAEIPGPKRGPRASRRRSARRALARGVEDWKERRKRGFSKDELIRVRKVLDDHALDEVARDLHSLELRALRLERIGRHEPGEVGERLSAEAERLNDVVCIALTRASASVIEHRAHRVVKGFATKCFFAAAATGIVLLWGAADYSKGQRDLIDLRKKCAEAVKSGAATACDPVVSSRQLEAGAATRKKEADAKAAAKRTAGAKRERDLLALEARMPNGAVKGIASSKRCAELVTGRLGSQLEAVRIASVQACVDAAMKRR